jgi:hypothetical protein
MFNHTVIGRYAAALAIAGAAVMPIVARADTPPDADADAQLVSGAIAADGGVERGAMKPQPDVGEESALIPHVVLDAAIPGSITGGVDRRPRLTFRIRSRRARRNLSDEGRASTSSRAGLAPSRTSKSGFAGSRAGDATERFARRHQRRSVAQGRRWAVA